MSTRIILIWLIVRTRVGERRNGKTSIKPAVFPQLTHHLGLLLLHPWCMAVEPVDEFLLRYVVTYKCRALLDLLTDKDQRVLTFCGARRGTGDAGSRVPAAVISLAKPKKSPGRRLAPPWWSFLKGHHNPRESTPQNHFGACKVRGHIIS